MESAWGVYLDGEAIHAKKNALLDISDWNVNQSVLGIVKTTNNVITLMEHATTDVKMGILDQTVQKNVHSQSMVKIVCTTVVETVKMVLGATYRLAGVTMAVKLDLRGSVVLKIVQVERLVKIEEVCVVGIVKITLLAIQEVDIVTIRVLQDFWEITAI